MRGSGGSVWDWPLSKKNLQLQSEAANNSAGTFIFEPADASGHVGLEGRLGSGLGLELRSNKNKHLTAATASCSCKCQLQQTCQGEEGAPGHPGHPKQDIPATRPSAKTRGPFQESRIAMKIENRDFQGSGCLGDFGQKPVGINLPKPPKTTQNDSKPTNFCDSGSPGEG